MDKTKFDNVLNYFTENNITLPENVKNSLQDVFEENDEIGSVLCYHKSELTEFQNDLTLHNHITIKLSGGSTGEINNVWSYFGAVEYCLNELIELVDDNGEVLETISDINNGDLTSLLYNSGEYVVTLIEVVKWESPDALERVPTLYIYCPEDPEDYDAKTEQVYNELKESENE